MQIPRIGIELRQLICGRLDDHRVAMTDVANIIDTVEVALTVFIEQVLPFPTDDRQRLTVAETQSPAEVPVANCEYF